MIKQNPCKQELMKSDNIIILDLWNIYPWTILLVEAGPFNEVFKELKNGATPYVKSDSLPKMHIQQNNIKYFTNAVALDNYMLSIFEDLSYTSPKYGLDT